MNESTKKPLLEVLRLIHMIIRPIVSIVFILLIFGMVISVSSNVSELGERNDRRMARFFEGGNYADAYDMMHVFRHVGDISGEEFERYNEFCEFYSHYLDFLMYNNAGDITKAQTSLDEMNRISKDSIYVDMAPYYNDILNSTDNE